MEHSKTSESRAEFAEATIKCALNTSLSLAGFTWHDLFQPQGLQRLDQAFLQKLEKITPILKQQLLKYRHNHTQFLNEELSELLINCAIVLEDFLAELFDIDDRVHQSQAKTIGLNPLSAFKKYFVIRRAKKELLRATNYPPFQELNDWLNSQLSLAPLTALDDKEMSVALLGIHYLNDPELHQSHIEKLVAWCVQALSTIEGRAMTETWSIFHLPARIDPQQLIPPSFAEENLRLRDGFTLTDDRMTARLVQDEVNYCIYCHDHDGDFCSKGFPQKKGHPQLGFKKNALNNLLIGCPLEEKISEMNFLKQQGHTLAALAVVMIDNPMCPATGHRICNDCMKACIYQKQEPVNIPQIETRVLIDVLDLPWGVEIYDLLTRWNPLRQEQAITKPYNGRKIMIAGLGPAGFTLAHHLLQEGYAVVGFDGLKIEPLPTHLISQPIYRYADLVQSLEERIVASFGGVAEYGITARWDKNFLKLIYLNLMRRPYFQAFGSVRFGGTLTVDDAWEMGFDHFVIAVGAGLPKALNIPNSLQPGMRQANDFLMALQLGGAFKNESMTSLQIRLPAVVIGGGLTAVDTATELQAYYIRQVEKVLKRYEILLTKYSEETFNQQLDSASREILLEFINHGKLIRHERELAALNKRKPNFIHLIRKWGGVTIVYRRKMQESKAYIHNHEELKKAFEEGINYLEELEPTAVELDEYGHVKTLVCQKYLSVAAKNSTMSDQEIMLPARAILVATGTIPNTAYEFEHRDTFKRLNLQYLHYEQESESGELNIVQGKTHCKEDHFGPFTSYRKNDYRVSLVGDTHPLFHGSVVKAIASAKRTYPKIVEILADKTADPNDYALFEKQMQLLFNATISSIKRKTHNVIEIQIHAPLACKHYQPGQFYRLQNYESQALCVKETLLLMEPIPLIASACDQQQGLLTFYVTENNSAALIGATLKPGMRVSLMGPTGVRTKIPQGHATILIIGNQSSFPFLCSFGKKLIEANNRVILLVKCANKEEIYCYDELVNASQIAIWLTENSMIEPKPARTHDLTLCGNDINVALQSYANTNSPIPLADVDRIYIAGETSLLKQFQQTRASLVKNYFTKNPKIFAQVYGNMQCMLKGVCGQCLQWQKDPHTGKRTKAVFACSWQDQPLEIIDIDHLDARLSQNVALEQFNHLWIEHLLDEGNFDKI